MEEMLRARYGERVQSFHGLSEHAFLPKSPHVHQPGSSPNPVVGFVWRLHYTSMIDETIGHWLLIQHPALLFSQEVRGWD